MMRQLTIALSLFAVITSQQTLAQTTDPVVMTVAGVPVSRSEFEYSYNKNNGEGVIDKLSVDEYVTLFINYKLKVAAALDAKLDTLSSFRQEYQMYRDQQVRPTMVTDAEVFDQARQMYERTQAMIGSKGLVRPAHKLPFSSRKRYTSVSILFIVLCKQELISRNWPRRFLKILVRLSVEANCLGLHLRKH